MSSVERVAKYRAKNRLQSKKTIEAQLSLSEVALLDALAIKENMSRSLLTSLILKDVLFKCGFFLSNGQLIDSSGGLPSFADNYNYISRNF